MTARKRDAEEQAMRKQRAKQKAEVSPKPKKAAAQPAPTRTRLPDPPLPPVAADMRDIMAATLYPGLLMSRSDSEISKAYARVDAILVSDGRRQKGAD